MNQNPLFSQLFPNPIANCSQNPQRFEFVDCSTCKNLFGKSPYQLAMPIFPSFRCDWADSIIKNQPKPIRKPCIRIVNS